MFKRAEKAVLKYKNSKSNGNGLQSFLKDWENRVFLVFFLIMFLYYGYRMFALAPWYDELYTYYYFISRGPLYAAIHWPLPNNHIGYSVLSGFLDLFGNSAIGLRGISWISALMNLILIYIIGRKHFKRFLSLGVVFLYASMNLVNQLAVQGRGYTLAVTCYLLAFIMVEKICMEKTAGRKHYILFALSLTLGLYVLPSSFYWVMPICLSGGIYLFSEVLKNREKSIKIYKESDFVLLIKLVVSAICAALFTVMLYATVWLAIGSNLLSKDETGGFAGFSHIRIILKAPIKAIGTGMEYMLATPYIQSEERAGFGEKLYNWFLSLFGFFYNGLHFAILIILVTGIIFLIIQLLLIVRRKSNEKKKEIFLVQYLLMGICMIPGMLVIQCALPYYRVFSFMAFLISVLVMYMIQKLIQIISWKYTTVIIMTAITVFSFEKIASKAYNDQYSMREYYIQDALSKTLVSDAQNVCVSDCTTQYMIKYLYGIECENQVIDGSDMVLLDKRMLDSEYNGYEWEFYHYYATIPWDYVNEYMTPQYENAEFVLYVRN